MLQIENISKTYYTGLIHKKPITALQGISFQINEGEVFGIVGESGSGKTTIARIILNCIKPDTGKVELNGEEISGLKGKALRDLRLRVQTISQNSDAALNPRMKIKESLAEVFRVKNHNTFKALHEDDLVQLMEEVGLQEEHLSRYPVQLSGGQLQRIVIARVMALEPEIIVADEPTSGLDVSVQAQIIELLLKIKEKSNFTLILISHDIDLVAAISKRMAVMCEGKIVEIGKTEQLTANPQHYYTKELFNISCFNSSWRIKCPIH